jgi:hypothetical protein
MNSWAAKHTVSQTHGDSVSLAQYKLHKDAEIRNCLRLLDQEVQEHSTRPLERNDLIVAFKDFLLDAISVGLVRVQPSNEQKPWSDPSSS